MPIDTTRATALRRASEPACAAVVAARLNAPEHRGGAAARPAHADSWPVSCPTEPATVAGAALDAGPGPRAGAGVDRVRRTVLAATGGRSPPPRVTRSPRQRLLDHKLGGPSEERRCAYPSYVAASRGAAGPRRRPGLPADRGVRGACSPTWPPACSGARSRPGVGEVLAWAGTPLATAEVALLCGMDRDEARAALAEAGAVERPVEPDAFWSL